MSEFVLANRDGPNPAKQVTSSAPPEPMTTLNVEYTDTFGGEANYSWVRRARICVPEWNGDGQRESAGYQRMVMRRAKAAMGLTGVRGTRAFYGDVLDFRPYRSCTVMFVTADY